MTTFFNETSQAIEAGENNQHEGYKAYLLATGGHIMSTHYAFTSQDVWIVFAGDPAAPKGNGNHRTMSIVSRFWKQNGMQKTSLSIIDETRPGSHNQKMDVWINPYFKGPKVFGKGIFEQLKANLTIDSHLLESIK